ncbi:MAG: hypothetical protein GF353_00390 [Candidatus Lokiarchaeota archaeon]|nr:hypothetical protein [Candidatus Lokiarchaeota archaeon]
MDTITLVLTILLFVYITIVSIHVVWVSRKIEWQVKYYYFGIATYMILFVISQTLFVINELLATPGFGSVPQRFLLLYIVANFIGQLAIFGIILVVEKYVYNKLHYIPSVIVLITAFLILFLPQINNLSMIIVYILIGAIIGALVPIIYFVTGMKLSGKARNKSFIIGFGLLIFIIGILLNTYFLLELVQILAYVAPIIQLVGIAIFHYGFLIYYQIYK